MVAIALFGAGGKMGARLSRNLQASDYDVRHVEVSEAGQARLRSELCIDCVDPETALDGADVVILAVPDTLVGKVAHDIEKSLNAGTIVIALDAAAPFAGHLPDRSDLTYFVTHPCHPPIFNDEVDPAARDDRFADRVMLFRSLHQRVDDALPGVEPAEAVVARRRIHLVIEDRRMTGMGDEIGQV